MWQSGLLLEDSGTPEPNRIPSRSLFVAMGKRDACATPAGCRAQHFRSNDSSIETACNISVTLCPLFRPPSATVLFALLSYIAHHYSVSRETPPRNLAQALSSFSSSKPCGNCCTTARTWLYVVSAPMASLGSLLASDGSHCRKEAIRRAQVGWAPGKMRGSQRL